MAKTNRRTFLKQSSRVYTGLALGAGALGPRKTHAANDRVRFALLGCGGRGRYVAHGLITAGAELVYLCDLRSDRLGETEKFLGQVQAKKPKKTKQMQQVFDAQDIDAVVVATPDHWHGPASIMAVQAGKDVYVEKPHAYNIWESRMMIECARKSKQLIQAGTQNRSAPYNKAALEFVKTGKLGRIGLVKVYNLKSGGAFRFGQTDPLPAGFDWDAWLGPAQERPFHSRLFHGGWHKLWDFSGGDLADDGIHQLDLALMLMGDPGMPQQAACTAGRKVHAGDDAEVPDVQVASYDFKDFVMTLELTNYPRYMQKTTTTIRRNDVLPYWTQNATRVELYGSDLMMTIGRHGGGWQVTTSAGKVVEQMYGRPADMPHYENFIDCVKTRKTPNADVQIAHRACSMVHMANIAHRLGNCSLKFDERTNRFVDNAQANQLIKRTPYRQGYEPKV